MEPVQIYDALEDAWKTAAIRKMALAEINSGRQQANPEAYTMAAQEDAWRIMERQLRAILDALEICGKYYGDSPEPSL
jgi:hypothetical protein